MGIQDEYEFLPISPDAGRDTTHRTDSFLAFRLHPDNGETGHPPPLPCPP
jgi:hypothetical protein